MNLFLYVFASLYIINEISSDRTGPIVEIPLGKIAGTYERSFIGREYKAFQGVPYAKPPVDERRFKEPERIEKWDGTVFATKKPLCCIQYRPPVNTRPVEIRGQEDCLYLNIYVPTHNKRELLPVLISFQGGSYTNFEATTKVEFVMDRDVIFTSMNSRLGILGYVSTEDQHIPGNMGLKDQSMAIRWISENIKYFGGDPNRITLIGVSSGAANVHYQYLSPTTRGLFRNGISFSGTSIGIGKIHKGSLKKFLELGRLLKCPVKYISETVECLRRKPAKDIVEATEHFFHWISSPKVAFGPVVEKGGQHPFINKRPIDMLRDGDVDDALWITGVVSDEGLVPGAEFVDDEDYLKQLDESWNHIAPHLLMFYYTIPIEHHNHFSKKIREHYFGKEKITRKNSEKLISLIGDRLYCSNARKAAKLQAKKMTSSVLFWYYSHRAENSFSDYLMKVPRKIGVCHADDFFTAIGDSLIHPPRNPDDRAVQIKLLDFITSVAAEGYPKVGDDVTWEKVDPGRETLDMLHFANSKNIRMETKNDFCNYQFWDNFEDFEDQF